jgi:predicted transcriptional regulator
MPRPKASRPTDGELEILGILWHSGPSTVREIHARLSKTKDTGYTTVLKLMQIMTDKGLLLRENHPSANSHLYRPAHQQSQTQRQLIRDLLDRAFGGSTRSLILHALSSKKASKQELTEIRNLLDEIESKSKSSTQREAP